MNFPYAPRLDSRVVLTGTYVPASGKTFWTMPIEDDTIDAVVLGDDFGPNAGEVITPTVSGTTVYVTGDFSAGECILGRLYTMSIELSRPYRRDQQGQAILNDRIQLRAIQTAHTNAGAYSIRAEMASRTDRVKDFEPSEPTLIEEAGHFTAFHNGDAKSMRLFIENETAKPSTIGAVDYMDTLALKAGR